MEHTAELRIAVVGGAPLIQAGMAAVLAEDARFRTVFQAPDVPSALDGVGRPLCDVVVLNTESPRGDVASLLGGVEARGANERAVRVLALTDDESPEEALATLQAGAQGYGVRRHLWPEDLRAGILAVGRGLPWLCPFVTQYLIAGATAGFRAGALRHDLPPGGLSPRELEVLRLAAGGTGDSDIATLLTLSPNSVKTYWQRIRAKLPAASRQDAIRQAVIQGLIPDRRQRPRE
jgi:DNA-binding NarL/FixJ family response regulator